MAYTVYKDRNNTFALQLLKDGVVLTSQEIDAILTVEILHNGSYYNSTQYPSAFDKTTRKAEGIIIFKLGEIADLMPGHDQNAELIIYSADYDDGLVWTILDLNIVELFGEVVTA